MRENVRPMPERWVNGQSTPGQRYYDETATGCR
jgi:hypothetical protein